MAVILTIENEFKHQDISVRKELYNECLARIISTQEYETFVIQHPINETR